METYQDLLVISQLDHRMEIHDFQTVKILSKTKNNTQGDNGLESDPKMIQHLKTTKIFMKEVHQRVVDTLHPASRKVVEVQQQFARHRVDTLLMDEESMCYFSEMMELVPDIQQLADRYLLAILKVYKDSCDDKEKKQEIKAISKILKKIIKEKKKVEGSMMRE